MYRILPKGGVYPYDANNPIRVGITLADHDGAGAATAGANNPTFDFVPATNAPVATPRAIVNIDNCNECHKTLGAHHSGSRNDTKLCVTCHNPTHGDPESGNALDLKVMVHKIHMGKNLPSVKAGTKYIIWGNSNSVHDNSEVNFPAYAANCTKCHKKAADADNYKTKPTKEACGACHDGIKFADGTGTRVVGYSQGTSATSLVSSNSSLTSHVGGAQSSNSGCSFCHGSTGTQGAIDSMPAPIPDAHDFLKKFAVGENTAELTMTAPANGKYFVAGEKPKLTITLKDSAGAAINPTTIAETGYSLQLAVSGPRALRKPVLTTFAVEPIFGKPPVPGVGVVGGAGYRNELKNRSGTTAANANGTPTFNNLFAQDDYGVRWDINGNKVVDATKVTGVVNRADTAKIEYQLAAVPANMTAGTYVAYVYFYTPTNKKMPAYKLINFQVGTETVEKKVATNCLDCHSSGTQAEAEAAGSTVVRNLWHVSRTEHPAQYDPDYCGNCHDYAVEKDGETNNAANTAAGAGVWKQNKLGFGGMPVSKRIHAIHRGEALAHKATADATNAARLTLPQDLRNCEKCHPATTSTNTWSSPSTAKTPMRTACSGCHDSDAQWAHMTTMTVDPTPWTVTAGSGVYPPTKGPFSGDEQEACAACHQ